VADALDRTHFSVVKDLSCSLTDARLVVDIDTGGENADLELWAANRRVAALSRLLERPVVLRQRTGRLRTALPRTRALA
jgi:hypothetical protein